MAEDLEIRFVAMNYFLDDESLMERLLDAGAYNRERDSHGSTVLLTSSFFRNRNIVEALLKRDAVHDLVNNSGFTPLLMAVSPNYLMTELYTNQLLIIRMLLEKGADVNVAGFQGTAPLMLAGVNLNSDVVKVLLEAGVDVCKRDAIGRNSICYIIDSRNFTRQQKIKEVKELMKISTLIYTEKLSFNVSSSFRYRIGRFADDCYEEVRRMSFITLSRRWTLRDFALRGRGPNPEKIMNVAFEKLMEQNFSIYNDYLASHFDKSYLVDKLMMEGIIVYSRTGLTDVKLRDHLIPDFCEFLTKTDIYNLLEVVCRSNHHACVLN